MEIGLMASSFLVAGLLATPAMGRLTDRFGPGRVLWVGVALHGLFVLAYIPAQHPFLLIGLRALEGIAAAAVLPPARALVNAFAPSQRQGEALGLLNASQMAGMLLGPAVGAFLAGATHSYNAAFALGSIPLFLGAIAARLLLPAERRPTHPLSSETVPRRGLRLRLPLGRHPARSILFTRPLMLTYALQLLLGLSGGVGMAAWTLYMADRGSSVYLIGLSYTTYALPSILLAPFLGRLSDRYGRYWPAIIGLLGFGVVFSAYKLPLSPLAIVLVSLLEGLPSSLVSGAVGGLLADVTPSEARGRAQANFSAAGTLGSLLSATFAGAFYALDAGLPFLLVGVVYIVAALCLLAPGLAALFPAGRVAGGSHETHVALDMLEPMEERSSVPHA